MRKRQWEDDDAHSSGRPVEKDYYTKYRNKVYEYDDYETDDDEYSEEYYDYGDNYEDDGK